MHSRVGRSNHVPARNLGFQMIHRLLAVTVFAVASVPASYAAVVYTSSAFAVAASPDGSPWCSSCNGYWEVSDIFTLSSSDTISGVDFAIVKGAGTGWNIEISIWDTALTSKLFSVTMPSGSYAVNNVNNVSLISAAFAGPALAAGSYRMSWYEASGMGVWGYKVGSTLWQSFPTIGGDNYERNEGAAFQIYGAVPEAGTYAMMLLGLVGVGLAARRRR